MNLSWTIVFSLASILLPANVRADKRPEQQPCSQITYESHNMIDYGPLRVSVVKGIVKDVQDVVVSRGCVGVFSSDAKKLIAFAAVTAEGAFEIQHLSRGDYRLLVAVDGFCVANAKIKVGRGFRSRRYLFVRMKPSGIDSCSWIEAK